MTHPTNEAAERLRTLIHGVATDADIYESEQELVAILDAALAIERQASEAAPSPDPLEGQAADMCPNCVTPWKCNGPHLAAPSLLQERDRLDPYDMRIMVRALYSSGLSDDMNPSDRRKTALRLRDSLCEWNVRLAATSTATEEPTDD